MSGSGYATGKVILLGEHAVVYGHRAIVAGIDRGVRASVRRLPPSTGIRVRDERGALLSQSGDGSDLSRALEAIAVRFPSLSHGLDVVLDSELPAGVGLGSSAALSVAFARALNELTGDGLKREQIVATATLGEAVFHDRPSGADPEAASRLGVLLFQRGSPPVPLKMACPLRLVVAVMEPAMPTRETVGRVRALRDSHPERFEPLLAAIGGLVDSATSALSRGDLSALGALMNENHALLQALHVSTPVLDAGQARALDCGALGCKLSGGGGGGCLIALAANRELEVTRSLTQAGAMRTFAVTIDSPRRG